MTKVIVFGTFDLLHPGHINFLHQAVKYGDFLMAVVARDKTVFEVKGKLPINNEKTRVRNLAKLSILDKVVLGSLDDKYAIIKKEKPEVICLGYDQNSFTKGLEEKIEELKLSIKIIRLKAYKPDIYKSSKMRGKNASRNNK